MIGAAVGILLSGRYLYRNFGGNVVPDPIWVSFVKVFVLMFSSIYLFQLLRRLLEHLRRGR